MTPEEFDQREEKWAAERKASWANFCSLVEQAIDGNFAPAQAYCEANPDCAEEIRNFYRAVKGGFLVKVGPETYRTASEAYRTRR
jgi:hypothetical protein